jgi:ferredoxin--NADP+ reductase
MIRPVFTGKENMSQIVSVEKLTDSITALEIAAPEIAAATRTGQIVMIRVNDETHARPKAIADVNLDKGTITIVVQQREADVDGRTADSAMPAVSAPGADAVAVPDENSTIHLEGPLGLPGEAVNPGKALLVAEGMGIPAVFARLRQLKEAGCYTMLIAGYPSKSQLFWLDRLDHVCDELYVVTEDGSFGIKGPVRQTVKAVCDQVHEIEHVFAAGPLDLLKSTSNVTRQHQIPTAISLAAVLDGPAETRGDYPAEGADGAPSLDWSGRIQLDGHQVDFDELTRKLGLQKK